MAELIDETALRRKTAEYLFKIGNLVSNTCAPASRFYMSNLERRLREFPDFWKNKNKSAASFYCHHCGSIWNSSNCKIRTQSCQRLNSHIKKLLKMERNEEWKLNNQQKKKLKKFYNSTSKIAYKCLSCQKVTYFPGLKSNSRSCSRSNTTSTPVPKLKLNKSDVNAGLFIPSPIVTSINDSNDLDKSEVLADNGSKVFKSSVNSCDSSFNISNSTKETLSNSLKRESTSAKTLLESSKQSSAKRKKSLLAQILDQEQGKKKKNSLSSFLVSL